MTNETPEAVVFHGVRGRTRAPSALRYVNGAEKTKRHDRQLLVSGHGHRPPRVEPWERFKQSVVGEQWVMDVSDNVAQLLIHLGSFQFGSFVSSLIVPRVFFIFSFFLLLLLPAARKKRKRAEARARLLARICVVSF